MLGKKIELVQADNKSDKVENVANAAASLVNAKVSAVLGGWGSSLSISGGTAFLNAKIPAIGTSATNPQVTQGNPYYYRVCFIDPFQGTVMANYAYDKLGKTKVPSSAKSTVTIPWVWPDSLRISTKQGGTIVATYDFNTGDQDFNAILTNLKSSGAEVVFAPSNYTEAGLFVKQAKEMGIELPFLGGDTWETPSSSRSADPPLTASCSPLSLTRIIR